MKSGWSIKTGVESADLIKGLTCVNKNAIICVIKNAVGEFIYEDQYLYEIGIAL